MLKLSGFEEYILKLTVATYKVAVFSVPTTGQGVSGRGAGTLNIKKM